MGSKFILAKGRKEKTFTGAKFAMMLFKIKAQSTQDAGRDAQRDPSKWDLLM